MGPLAQPALVDEDDGAPLAERFFLSRGQRTRFQYRIACSSRSSAFPVGRWQLHPSWRRMRQTWASWYRTPHWSSISSRTRLAVHSPVANPAASGPRLSDCSICLSWAPLNLGLRPARPAFFNPLDPCLSNCAASIRRRSSAYFDRGKESA